MILESLRLAPNSYGLEWWKFVLVENPSKREELVWYARWQKQIVDASHLIVLCRTTDDSNKLTNDFIDRTATIRNIPLENLEQYKGTILWALWQLDDVAYASYLTKQVYIAAWFALLTCALLWVDACPMEWFDNSKFDEVLWLKDLWLASCMLINVWYRSEDDAFANFAKVRKSADEVIVRI